MDPTPDEVAGTLSLIEGLKLPHPSGELLSCFVTDALNPLMAARYVKNRVTAGEALALVSNWTFIVEASMACTFTAHPNPL